MSYQSNKLNKRIGIGCMALALLGAMLWFPKVVLGACVLSVLGVGFYLYMSNSK